MTPLVRNTPITEDGTYTFSTGGDFARRVLVRVGRVNDAYGTGTFTVSHEGVQLISVTASTDAADRAKACLVSGGKGRVVVSGIDSTGASVYVDILEEKVSN
jgi:glutamine amidotransferase-like uncharacterized protein